ncbi:MAG TPA: heme lyase CcmF/NrfE family subunit [Candidatus Limnocylindria bacterium]|nr:heme lyase CcmF/NrfE family subunit [Candidatus Limnocylindria bacterium]
MIPSLGHAAVVVALATCLYAVGAFVLAGRRRDPVVLDSARRAMLVTLLLVGLACIAMVVSLVTHDFSVRYVVRNNATTTPLFYSVIGLWAALEGSILFWALLAGGWATAVLFRYRDRHPALMPWVGAVLALGLAFFLAVMVWPGDPFVRVTPVSPEGLGPNALLQNHPFMGLHPPLLYLGYTGMAVPFAFGMAALITGRTDAEWLGLVRRWTIVPWIFLSLGIVAGGWWSYEVLGWGGYWAWDPVENAALLPWLTATAFLHSSMVAERRGSLRAWTHLLVIATFVLTLLGTFLTRSGVILSVHAFSLSAIGAWFGSAVLLALAGSTVLLVWRLPALADRRPLGGVVSRESAFLFNNVLFIGITFAVLFGTLFPLLVDAFSGAKVSVGAPWFDRVAGPMLIALLFLMGVGPALPWGGASWRTVVERFGLPVLVGVLAVVLAMAVGHRELAVLAVIGLATFVVVVAVDEVLRGAAARARSRAEAVPVAAWRVATRNRRRYGGYLVHAGVCVMAVAIAVSASGASEATVVLATGETTTLGAYRLTNRALVQEPLADDARVLETRVDLTLAGGGTLRPALRDYPNSTSPIATPAVRAGIGEDLYVTLLAYDPASGSVTLRIFVNPLVSWIWVGGGLLGMGAVFAAWPDRRLERVVAAAGGAAGTAA